MNFYNFFLVALSTLSAPLVFSKPLDAIPDDPKIKIGIYIGTFDPPHLGHLKVAKAAIASGHVDYVLFLPNDNAHHKPLATPFHLRHKMGQLTVASFERILTPDLPRVTQFGYVKDTLIELQQKKRQVTLVGMLGTDIARIATEIFNDQKFWMGIVESFLINEREGYDQKFIPKEIEGRKVSTFIAFDGGLSSTQMREFVAQKSYDIFKHIDPHVVNIIKEYRLWSDQKSCRLVYLRPSI